MPAINEIFLVLVIGSFALFGAALAYASAVASSSQ